MAAITTRAGKGSAMTNNEVDDNVLFHDTKGADIASASTVNLDAATGRYLHITGTTGVTAFTLGAGKERVVVFDGACTITHNASSLISHTGASFTTAAGDIMKLRAETANNVRIVGYLRKDVVGAILGANTYTGDQTLGNNALKTIKTATFNGQIANAGTSGAIAIDWRDGNFQTQAEPTGTITYTFTAPPGIGRLQLLIISDGTSTAQTINFPASVKQLGTTWAGANNKNTLLTFFYDGTSYWMIGSNEV